MKLRQISVMVLILAVVFVSGCKAAQEQPLVEDTLPSEQAVDSGLQELEEIDSLQEETDLGLEEIEQMQLE